MRLAPHVFDRYPSLRARWAEVVVIGPYRVAGARPGELVIRNIHGDKMAVLPRDLDPPPSPIAGA